MLINPEGSPFYIFRHYATFFERKNIFQKFQFFSKKNLLRFLSLRYGADFRRSRLVTINETTKLSGSIKDSLGFSALCDTPETFIKNFFEEFLQFFERFSVEKGGFLLFQVGGKVVFESRSLNVSLRVFFEAVKL